MYAPAFWPAAWTDACAADMPGVRAAKRGGRDEGFSGDDDGLEEGAGELLLDGFSLGFVF